MVTVRKRETSLEGLVSQFEAGEDALYPMMTEDKNVIFRPKVAITQKDLDDIPELRQLRDAIKIWENMLKKTSGKNVYLIKKILIEMRKDQYVIKNAFRQPIPSTNLTYTRNFIPLADSWTLGENDLLEAKGVSLTNPKVCAAILKHYSALREDAAGNFEKDLWYVMEDFDHIATLALAPYPLYERIVEYKIDRLTSVQIQKKIEEEFNVNYTIEYISALWTKKIPKLIATKAEEEIIQFYYTNIKKGKYKYCKRCKTVKLMHPFYFAKNKPAKDGYYSICKECRSKASKEKK